MLSVYMMINASVKFDIKMGLTANETLNVACIINTAFQFSLCTKIIDPDLYLSQKYRGHKPAMI
jgi:hypothetical protein